MANDLRRTWARIDLDALSYNYRAIRRHTGPGVKFLGVVKADAYGHGAVEVSRHLQDLGADYLAVATADEALELRRSGIILPILILGYTPADQVEKLLKYRITQTVGSLADAQQYSRAAVKLSGRLNVHIKVNTGMSRLGFEPEETEDICTVCQLPGLLPEGIFTHFAAADEEGEDGVVYTQQQLGRFARTVKAVEALWGETFALHHCANSGGTADWPGTHWDMVRPGLLLYGYGRQARKLGLRPVMALQTSVCAVKNYAPGTAVSYGCTYVTERATRMGVLPVGYADGLHRCLSGRFAPVTEYGPAPQRGRICMDMCMIDLTEQPGVKVGATVEIFGPQNPVEELAELAGTIPYELTCAVSPRVPREYVKNGVVVKRELLLRS